VIPVLTPEEMAGVDRAAPEAVEVLVARAGFALARAARHLMGGAYGRRVAVVAGRGNNGADGRVAAGLLAGWGAMVRVLEASSLAPGARLGDIGSFDLVVDAAYGTGLSREYSPPDPGTVPVLAVDIPSGLSGLTGQGGAMAAVRTLTFAALKPGLLLGAGPDLAGDVEIADIGLGGLAGRAARAWVVTDSDVLQLLPVRHRRTHKWEAAVEVIGGSPTMNGAPLMTAHGAMRAGAGYALVAVPGSPPGGGLPPGEYVGLRLPEHDWDAEAAEGAKRVKALAIGPGLGSSALGSAGRPGADTPVGKLLARTHVPAVVDADGLTSLGDLQVISALISRRQAPLVITPHEGEYLRITGHKPADDRIADVRHVASQTGAVVLLKGAPTVVADPDGRVMIVTSGSARLATAGTGDVLTGVIAAFLARGLPPLEAAAIGAHCHGRAAGTGRAEGLIASDLPDAVSTWLSELRA
jgi:NAD(P)H-hydrate epimerase